MRILHTEASPGWGGQEIRILREAEGMRKRGHHIIMAIRRNGKLAKPAREAGFIVYELPFDRLRFAVALFHLLRIIRRHDIDVINTHSSIDGWIGGIASRLLRRKVVRTRHLSTPIKPGWNSVVLYNWFADSVVTTCHVVVDMIRRQARLSDSRCLSIPTGIDPDDLFVEQKEAFRFRESLGIDPETCLVGTACVLRSWKGISDLLQAARILRKTPKLKWLIVGGGVSEKYFREQWRAFDLEETVFFTGHLENPYAAISSMDVFALLSTGNEGVSQASLQAAYLCKPLLTTTVGGLPEVCLHGETGYCVSPSSPYEVVESVLQLYENPSLRKVMGEKARRLVLEKFTMEKTLDDMEFVYKGLK